MHRGTKANHGNAQSGQAEIPTPHLPNTIQGCHRFDADVRICNESHNITTDINMFKMSNNFNADPEKNFALSNVFLRWKGIKKYELQTR
jgi:hypothetical protein